MIEQAGEPTLQLQVDPAEKPGDRIPWPAFFERFEDGDLTLLHHNPSATEGAGSGDEWQVVVRNAIPDHVKAAEMTEEPTKIDSDQLAVSDTGEGEPVIEAPYKGGR